MSKAKDSITINENNDNIEIIINMKSIIPCVNSIKQYNPRFHAKDIITQSKFFNGTLIEDITDFYNEILFVAIENNNKENKGEI